MTKMMTSVVWRIPCASLTLAQQPDETHLYDCDLNMIMGGVRPSEHRQLRSCLKNDSPRNHRAQYPRFICSPDVQNEWRFVNAPRKSYKEIARAIPNVFSKNAKRTIRVELSAIQKVAEKYGRLYHHWYGDSLYGWVFTAALFQMLIRIENALRQPDEPHEGRQYARQLFLDEMEFILKTLSLRYVVVGQHQYRLGMLLRWAEHWNDVFSAWRLLRSEKLTKKSELKNFILRWLCKEFASAVNHNGASTYKFYFAHPDLYIDKKYKLLESNDTFQGTAIHPYVVVHTGLYAHALQEMILTFKSKGVLKSCRACGKWFLPRSKKKTYCGNTCVKAAHRAKLYAEHI